MELTVVKRNILGKKVKTLRKSGFIPAELYGHSVVNEHLSIPEKELEKVYAKAGKHSIVTLATEDGRKIPVIISGSAKNPITQKFLSIDLRQIRMDEEITANIPIEFTGEAPASKKGLIVVKVLNEIEIKALPANLPNVIKVNLDSLEEAHQNISIEDLKLPKTCKTVLSGDTIIVTVTEHKEEVAEQPALTAENPEATTGNSTETPETENKEN